MGQFSRVVIAGAAFALGVAGTAFYLGQPRQAEARTDRYNDYVLATGAVGLNGRATTDGVWLLDYRSGKLLGTVVDTNVGKVIGWAEVDLVNEFRIKPGEDVHFMMTTGQVSHGQAALYVAEVKTGRVGVYTMRPGQFGQGVQIFRHDLTTFRAQNQPRPAAGVAPAINPGAGVPNLGGQPGGVPPAVPAQPLERN